MLDDESARVHEAEAGNPAAGDDDALRDRVVEPWALGLFLAVGLVVLVLVVVVAVLGIGPA